MRVKHEAGYILFVVLVFLSVLAMLSVTGLTDIQTMLKIRQQRVERMQRVYELRQWMMQLAKREAASCVIARVRPSELMRMSHEWWLQHACAVQQAEHRYFYVREVLGQDSCAVIADDSVAAYERLTVCEFDVDNEKVPVCLQGSRVYSANKVVQCHGQEHTVKVGLQMWRSL